jgi:hypothetical protein
MIICKHLCTESINKRNGLFYDIYVQENVFDILIVRIKGKDLNLIQPVPFFFLKVSSLPLLLLLLF